MGVTRSKIILQDKIKDGVTSRNITQINKIVSQMEKSICKINNDKENKVGTGFFCKLPFPDRFN
jgi:hypothetical protein